VARRYGAVATSLRQAHVRHCAEKASRKLTADPTTLGMDALCHPYPPPSQMYKNSCSKIPLPCDFHCADVLRHGCRLMKKPTPSQNVDDACQPQPTLELAVGSPIHAWPASWIAFSPFRYRTRHGSDDFVPCAADQSCSPKPIHPDAVSPTSLSSTGCASRWSRRTSSRAAPAWRAPRASCCGEPRTPPAMSGPPPNGTARPSIFLAHRSHSTSPERQMHSPSAPIVRHHALGHRRARGGCG